MKSSFRCQNLYFLFLLEELDSVVSNFSFVAQVLQYSVWQSVACTRVELHFAHRNIKWHTIVGFVYYLQYVNT